MKQHQWEKMKGNRIRGWSKQKWHTDCQSWEKEILSLSCTVLAPQYTRPTVYKYKEERHRKRRLERKLGIRKEKEICPVMACNVAKR